MRVKIEKLKKSEDEIFRNEQQTFCKFPMSRCVLCGKATDSKLHIHIRDYGDTISDDTDTFEDDSLGLFSVGPCCFDRVKKAFGGKYPDIVNTISVEYNSLVFALGMKTVDNFRMQVERLMGMVPEDEIVDLLACLADYIKGL